MCVAFCAVNVVTKLKRESVFYFRFVQEFFQISAMNLITYFASQSQSISQITKYKFYFVSDFEPNTLQRSLI